MINMGTVGLKLLVSTTTLDFLMQTIFLSIFLGIIHFKMMTMMTFLAVFLVKGPKTEILKALAIADLALEEDLARAFLDLNHYFKMTIFLQDSEVEVISLHLNLLLLEIKV
jgi:ethanolamine utilization cobalamin adenosyltransferase